MSDRAFSLYYRMKLSDNDNRVKLDETFKSIILKYFEGWIDRRAVPRKALILEFLKTQDSKIQESYDWLRIKNVIHNQVKIEKKRDQKKDAKIGRKRAKTLKK